MTMTFNIVRLYSNQIKKPVCRNVTMTREQWRRVRNRLNAECPQGQRVQAEPIAQEQMELL